MSLRLSSEFSTEDLVGIDTRKLSSLLAAMMRTIDTQAHFIENMDIKVKQEFERTEMRNRAEFERLSEAVKETLHIIREESRQHESNFARLQSDVSAATQELELRNNELRDGLNASNERFTRELERQAVERQVALDREARARAEDILAVRGDLSALDKFTSDVNGDVQRLKDLTSRIESEVVHQKNDLGELAVHFRVTSEALQEAATDADDIMALIGLTRAQVRQAVSSHTQVETLHGTPAWRALISDLSSRLDAVGDALKGHDHAIATKADRDATLALHEEAVAASADADRNLMNRIEELASSTQRHEDVTERVLQSLRSALDVARSEREELARELETKLTKLSHEEAFRMQNSIVMELDAAMADIRGEKLPDVHRAVESISNRLVLIDKDMSRMDRDLFALERTKASRVEVDDALVPMATKRDVSEVAWEHRTRCMSPVNQRAADDAIHAAIQSRSILNETQRLMSQHTRGATAAADAARAAAAEAHRATDVAVTAARHASSPLPRPGAMASPGGGVLRNSTIGRGPLGAGLGSGNW